MSDRSQHWNSFFYHQTIDTIITQLGPCLWSFTTSCKDILSVFFSLLKLQQGSVNETRLEVFSSLFFMKWNKFTFLQLCYQIAP